MDYTEYTSAKNKLGVTPTLCDLFKLLSIETWKRIEYGYLRSGIKVFETTVTQNLIFSINAYNDQYKLGIEIFEAVDENTNGNDLELIIRFPGDGLEFYCPIQAKKVYKNGRYSSMDHGEQIEALIKYGTSKKAEPLYLLYNYTPTPHWLSKSTTKPSELFGCTLISAKYLFDNYYKKKTRHKRDGTKELTWLIPNLFDLNPSPAFAWHEIVCSPKAIDLKEALVKKGIISRVEPKGLADVARLSDFNRGFFPINTFNGDNKWMNIKDLTKSSTYEDDDKWVSRSLRDDQTGQLVRYKDSNSEKRYPDFKPKSRVVVTQKQSINDKS